jgi:hypothetical protein
MNRLANASLGLLVLAAVGACTSGSGEAASKPTANSTPVASCGADVLTGSLPTWARGGFKPADQAVPHVVGAKGDIAGVLFGFPLSYPRHDDRSNKILWVSKPQVETGSTLRIHATLDGTTTVADRKVEGGPGPSNIDLPKAGCWTLRLKWSGHTDTVRLNYVAQQ